MQRWGAGLAFAVCLLGCTVLGGWWLDVDVFKRVTPGWASMKANTALGLALLGGAVASTSHAPRGRHWRVLAWACAGAATLLGALTLLEYVTAVPLGLDETLARDVRAPIGGTPPGRPSPNTALGILTAGLSALAARGRRPIHAVVSEVFAVATLLIGLIGLWGYAYDARSLYRVAGFSSMALHTAACLAILGVAQCLVQPRGPGMREVVQPHFGGSMARRLLVPTLVLPLVVGFVWRGVIDSPWGGALLIAIAILLGAMLILRVARELNVGERTRLETQRQLREQRDLVSRAADLQQKILDGLPSATVVLDAKGQIMRHSRGMRDELAAPRLASAREGDDYLSLWTEPPQGQAEGYAALCVGVSEVLSGLRALYHCELATRHEGRTHWVDVWVAALDLQDGRGAVAMHLDVTDKHELEEALAVRRRLEAIGRLSAGVAHDFNNQLMTILGTVEVLLGRTNLDPGDREDLEVIRDAATISAQVTAQMLSLDSKSAEHHHEQTQVSSVLETLRRTFRRSLEERGHSLVTQLDGDLWPVDVEPAKLYQLLVNLVGNAQDAMPEAGRITVSAYNVPASSDTDGPRAGSFVCVEVSDTGHGMDAHTAARVFEPFFTTKDLGRGTGFGLTLCHDIVREAGGTISIESAPGEGTTFRLKLPQAQVEGAAA